MNKPQSEMLRGEAAYRARLKDVARSDEVAQAAAIRRCSAKEAVAVEPAERARREMRDLHRQADR